MRTISVIILAVTMSLVTPHFVLGYGGGGGGGSVTAESNVDRGDPKDPPAGFEPAESEDEMDTDNEIDSSRSDTSDSDKGQEDDLRDLVDEVKTIASTKSSTAQQQPSTPKSIIGTKGTLPGTRSATVENVDTKVNDDGSVTTWVEYSNDTWVETTVSPDGNKSVIIHLDSGKVIRPGREYLFTGGSLNPALDYTISVLECLAAAGTAAGWVLSVTPQGALASAGIKGATAVWATTVGIQSARAGVDAYAKRINAGASQSDAVLTGLKQTAVTGGVTTTVGKVYGNSPIGGKTAEVVYNQYKNVVADKVTGKVPGVNNPGYLPY
jgi:hypothetical protein